MLCRTPFHTTISLLCHLFIKCIVVQISKESCFPCGSLSSQFSAITRQPDIPTYWKIMEMQDQPIRSCSAFILELTALLMLNFYFFFNRENFIIKNSVSFLSFRIFFLNQQTRFASRDKGNILGLKHQYTMDGSKSYLVLLTWYLFFMIQGLVSSFWNTEVFFLPLRMEKTFLSNTAVLREKQESWKHHKKSSQNINKIKIVINYVSFLERKQAKIKHFLPHIQFGKLPSS